jgi:DNA-binding GntR family transcriptional regulator
MGGGDMGSAEPRAGKDRAYRFVKERILDGTYPGGGLLAEGEVAQATGMSRTPVREAFLLLEAEGLMRLYPKRGALVVAVSPEEVRDVMETRMLVERHAVARVAATEPALARSLAPLIRRQARLVARRDHAGFAEADREFHRAIVAAAGNAILTRLYDSLRDRQRRMGAASVARDPALAERFLADHGEIADAIGRGDPAAAEDAMARHLGRAVEGAGLTFGVV